MKEGVNLSLGTSFRLKNLGHVLHLNRGEKSLRLHDTIIYINI